MCTVSCSNFVFIFCSAAILAITFLKEVAKTKFAKISNKAKVKELAASNRISTTNVRVEIYKPRLLKLALIIIACIWQVVMMSCTNPGTIYSPPSCDVCFSSTAS